jgi:hypothetical protein
MARMKIIIGIAFLGILVSLAAAGVFMLKSDDTQAKTNHMARALALRIGISVALFILILLLWSLGVIRPTGIIPG